MMAGPTDPDCGAPWPTSGADNDALVTLMSQGELEISGLMPWSSNYTFLGQVRAGEASAPIIYKPIRGERPLWDFPRGTLAKREVAAFVVCHALGWDLIPPTVLRSGPHGRGSVQLFVQADMEDHFFTFREEAAFQLQLQQLAALDIITNNADRKGGHCLRSGACRIVAIDQGLCFHVEPKLRTVIWDYAGEPVPPELLADLSTLQRSLRSGPQDPVVAALSPLLYDGEIMALRRRIGELIDAGCYPDPPEDRRPYPWPLI